MTVSLPAAPLTQRSAIALLWRGLAGRRAGLLLAAAFIAALAIGNLLPQLPAEAADSGERTRWLVTAAHPYGSWGTLFQRLGLFDVAHAPWWDGLLAAGLCHALLRLADAVERAWRDTRRPASPALLPHAAFVDRDTDTTLAAIRQHFGQRRDSVAAHEMADGVTVWRAVQRPWSRWAHAGAWLGVTLLLLWGLLGDSGAWRVGSLSLPPGQIMPLGQGTGLSLRLAAAGDGFAVSWLRGDETLRQTPLAAGQPATYHGIGLHWRGSGPTLTVAAADGEGAPLMLEPVGGGQAPGETVSLVFDQAAEQTFAVPAYGLAVRVLTTPAGYTIEAYHSGEGSPFFTAPLTEAATLPIEEADYTFTPARFVRVTAQYTPFFPLLPLAGLLVLVGAAVHLAFPAQALWLRATPAGRGLWFEWATDGAMPDAELRAILTDEGADG